MKNSTILLALILTFMASGILAQVKDIKTRVYKRLEISSYLAIEYNNEPIKGELQTRHITKYDSLGRLTAEYDHYTQSYHENSRLLRRVKWDSIKAEYFYNSNDSISKMKVVFIGHLNEEMGSDTLVKYYTYDDKNNLKETHKSQAYITMGDYFGRTYSFGPEKNYYNFYLTNNKRTDSLVRKSYNELDIKNLLNDSIYFNVKRLFDVNNRLLEQEERTSRMNNYVKRRYNEIGKLSEVTKIEKTKEGMNIVTYNKSWQYSYTNSGRLKEEKYSQKYEVGNNIFKMGSKSKILNFDQNIVYDYLDDQHKHIITTFKNDKLIERTTKTLSEDGIVLTLNSITYRGDKEIKKLKINYYDSGIKQDEVELWGKRKSIKKFNEYGDLIHSLSYRKDKKIEDFSRKYDYNNCGDWIQIIYFDENVQPTKINERLIEYY